MASNQQSKAKKRITSKSTLRSPEVDLNFGLARYPKTIQGAAVTLSFAAGVYMVLYHDYGYEYHVFQPVRQWYQRKVNQFFTLSDKEKTELREQGRL